MTTTATTRDPNQPAPAKQKSLFRVIFASLIGTATEWYDFFLFGSAAALVFGTVFFPPEIGGTDGTLYAFMTYALGFFARPLGGLVFGHFGDKVGRKAMLVASLLIMGIGTFAIGLLPTYAQIGIAAPLLLVFCRLLQGFAVGGEWGGAVLMSSEHGTDKSRGFWASWPQAGVPLGNLLATAVLWILGLVQSPEDFNAWGWRIPFLLSGVLVILGLWVRSQVSDAAVFTDTAAKISKKHLPLVEVFRKYPREIFTAMGMRIAENISYYIITVISITYITTYAQLPKSVIFQALLIGGAIQFFLIPTIGALSDRVGRKPLYLAGALGVGIWTFAMFALFDTKNTGLITLAIIVALLFHALMYAPQAALFSELFGTSVRYTGASVGYQLASLVAAAPAPIIALALLGKAPNGNTTAVGIYVALASVITIVSVLAIKETRGSSLAHDRVVKPAAADPVGPQGLRRS